MCTAQSKNYNSVECTEPISTKLVTEHPWVKRIQVCSTEGLCLFPRGDNNEIGKIHLRNLKIFFSITKLGTKHPWVTIRFSLVSQINWHALIFNLGTSFLRGRVVGKLVEMSHYIFHRN